MRVQIQPRFWKMIIVACVVFCGTFFGSAIIAQIMLKLRGTI